MPQDTDIASKTETSKCRNKKAAPRAAFFFEPERAIAAAGAAATVHPVRRSNQVQVIRPEADDAQVFAVSECAAVAVQLDGGPETAVAVTVTFCEGRKP